MSSGKVLLGILAGAAAGALLGILFAPEKGEQTRRKIAKKGEDYADGLKEKFSELIDTVTDGLGSGNTTDLVQAAKSKFDGSKNPSEGSQKHTPDHLKTSM
jgi:gas vesicle protein